MVAQQRHENMWQCNVMLALVAVLVSLSSWSSVQDEQAQL